MLKTVLYMHGGSGNHGCEALVRTISQIVPSDVPIKVYSKNPEEDLNYISDFSGRFVLSGDMPSKRTLRGFIAAVRMKYLNQPLAYVRPAYSSLLRNIDQNTVAVSIGGDNYCYDGVPEMLAILNKAIISKGAKTVLYGCSIEPELLMNDAVVKDLLGFSLIAARESITYNSLIQAGISANTFLVSDPAFLLQPTMKELPKGFIANNTVGINVSPLVISSENGVTLLNSYCRLVSSILETTDMQIALIPHVVWKSNNDLEPLTCLYKQFQKNGRVIMIPDGNACELKGYISKCRFFVGARTHATISAYSSLVPTLVVGYSVKSRGIARDIFGNEDNYVISIKDIKTENDLAMAFDWLIANEVTIKEKLRQIMPTYVEKAKFPSQKIRNLM